eukprot:CAMPEP_0115118728 /NCGR_PEP_ID=MMETSP0227-20121206/44667_1 /TAXON_ID=89957 /ORGANISM="Polarella glacialis, Strain CCMP 1383" /LENGTH=680 /DNA_ID=CAMNT_0002520059 /DNA_START=122 /DNA_END=2162 /DNA_ORIENTATION=-
MADCAAGGHGVPGKEAAGGQFRFPGREQVADAVSAAQGGLASIIGSLADSQNSLSTRMCETQERLEGTARDVEKVFRRLHQMEARQVEVFNSSEAKLDLKFQTKLKQFEDNATNSTTPRISDQALERHSDLEFQVREQRQRLESLEEVVNPNMVESLKLLVNRREIQQTEEVGFQESMEGRLEATEKMVTLLLDAQQESLRVKIDESNSDLLARLEAMQGTFTAFKEQNEASNQRVRVIEQRGLRHANDVKQALGTLERHGLSASGRSLQLRLEVLEETSDDGVKAKLSEFEDRFAQLKSMLDGGLQRLQEGSDIQLNAAARMASLATRFEDSESDQRNFSTWARARIEYLEKQHSTEVKQVGIQLESFRTEQERRDDDVNKILRLGRILDDKVEVFDEMERRMDEISTQAQKILGAEKRASTRCLSCADTSADFDPLAEQGWGARTRSTSPPGGRSNRQPRGQSQWEAAGWVKVQGPRRPQSAGVRRTCDTGDQQQADYPRPPLQLQIQGGPPAQRLSKQELHRTLVAGQRSDQANSNSFLVLSVPQVRSDVYAGASPGLNFTSNRPQQGGALHASTGPVKPKTRQPVRPQSARGGSSWTINSVWLEVDPAMTILNSSTFKVTCHPAITILELTPKSKLSHFNPVSLAVARVGVADHFSWLLWAGAAASSAVIKLYNSR